MTQATSRSPNQRQRSNGSDHHSRSVMEMSSSVVPRCPLGEARTSTQVNQSDPCAAATPSGTCIVDWRFRTSYQEGRAESMSPTMRTQDQPDQLSVGSILLAPRTPN